MVKGYCSVCNGLVEIVPGDLQDERLTPSGDAAHYLPEHPIDDAARAAMGLDPLSAGQQRTMRMLAKCMSEAQLDLVDVRFTSRWWSPVLHPGSNGGICAGSGERI